MYPDSLTSVSPIPFSIVHDEVQIKKRRHLSGTFFLSYLQLFLLFKSLNLGFIRLEFWHHFQFKIDLAQE